MNPVTVLKFAFFCEDNRMRYQHIDLVYYSIRAPQVPLISMVVGHCIGPIEKMSSLEHCIL